MPNVNLNDFEGKSVNIREYTTKNHFKLVSLWATWCGPCRVELNALKKVRQEWADQYGLEIIAITLDNNRNVERAKTMAKSKNWDYTFFHDNSGELGAQLGIRGIPFSMLIDQNGNIISTTEGYYQGYEKKIESKLKELFKKS